MAILCSCNVLCSNTIQTILENHFQNEVPSVQEIMEKHGCSVVCATCAYNIKLQIRQFYGEKNES